MWKEGGGGGGGGGGVYNRQCAAVKLYLWNQNAWVPMQSGQAAQGLLIRRQKSGYDYTRNAYTQGKGELAWDIWPNCLVLRVTQTVPAV